MTQTQIIILAIATFLAGIYTMSLIKNYVPTPSFSRVRSASRWVGDAKVSLPLPYVLAGLLGLVAWLQPWQYIPSPTPPGPTPVPVPVVVEGFKVLEVEESEDRGKLAPERLQILMSTACREYVKSKGGELQLIDDDVVLDRAEPWVREAMKLPREGTPWTYITNGKEGYSNALPANETEMLELLKKYGEAK